ncbi:MAG: hypothetical protein HYW23_01300 [Candidatus Aenigmarchaeota archaeon]|nr:hypothetical protein [Candidatus Aenigmarchaeota archaeon]
MELRYVIPNVTNPRTLGVYFQGLKDTGVIGSYRGRVQPHDNGRTLIGDINVVLELLDETKQGQIDETLKREYRAVLEPVPSSV